MKSIKLLMIAAAASACGTLSASTAKPAVIPVSVNNVSVLQNESTLSVSMDIDPSNLKLQSSREIVARPVLTDSLGHELQLPAIYFAGHSRYYLHERDMDIKAPDTLIRSTKAQAMAYSVTVPYEDWMQESYLDMTYDLRGCACSPLDKSTVPVTELDFAPITFTPNFVTVTPIASGEKTREIKGSAYIDFPVNRIELYPNYRRNPEEIARIRASIDLVRDDPDASITSITIKGYASPEGPYSNNVRLAKGRTQTLRDYVQGLYALDKSIMHSEWEAEDWAGLRRFVEKSDLEWRDQILNIIDSDLEPDAKDRKLKTDFPRDYAYLLKNVYPGLRHSDYAVEYVIRSFTDVNEIAQVMRTNPAKLSIDELFHLGQSLDPESPEYAEVFELAVRMFPADPVANINAAVLSIRKGDYDSAERYLDKAGDTNESVYARGLIQALKGNYAEAAAILRPIAQSMPEAADALAQVGKIQRRLARRAANGQVGS